MKTIWNTKTWFWSERHKLQLSLTSLSRRNRSQFIIPLTSKFYNENTRSSRNNNWHSKNRVSINTKYIYVATSEMPEPTLYCNALSTPVRSHSSTKPFVSLRKDTSTWSSGLNPPVLLHRLSAQDKEHLLQLPRPSKPPPSTRWGYKSTYAVFRAARTTSCLLQPCAEAQPGRAGPGRHCHRAACCSGGARGEQPLGKIHTCSGLVFPLCHQEDGWWNSRGGKMLEGHLHSGQDAITKTKH